MRPQQPNDRTPPSDASYRLLCDSLGVALIATDPDLRIRVWNAAAARMFGAAADQMLGAPIASLVPRDRRPLAEEMVRKAIDTGEILQFEFDYRDAKGAARELAATASPIVGPDGHRSGASLCVRDITNRIILQQELSDSRKMGALGAMAGAVAHHFNNILGGAITSIDYALERNDPAADRRVLRQVSTALIRAMQLVKGLLLFSEGDRRAEDLCDLTELLTHLADDIEHLAAGRDISLVLEVPALPVIAVPRVECLTILRNIAQNAIEAMPDGGVLTVSARATDESAAISICDTGTGLDEDARSHLFEPFFTTKGELGTGAGRAAGLGLAIAHGLAKNIAARISVDSTPGKGTCFTLELPKSVN